MTADIVVQMSKRPQPVVWILHEWWDDEMITENLKARHIQHLSLKTVRDAMRNASLIVFVCEAQRQLYRPVAPSYVVYVGVPDPAIRHSMSDFGRLESMGSKYCELKSQLCMKYTHLLDCNDCFVFLCLGIVCPRKNQLWTVELFKAFVEQLPQGRSSRSVRLLIVGARETRVYEAQYLERVRQAVDEDSLIKLMEVTDDVDSLYCRADCLLLTSLNEVTPMVISEVDCAFILESSS
jgi:glycosyltransferase involved in cell wall biosynthesis